MGSTRPGREVVCARDTSNDGGRGTAPLHGAASTSGRRSSTPRSPLFARRGYAQACVGRSRRRPGSPSRPSTTTSATRRTSSGMPSAAAADLRDGREPRCRRGGCATGDDLRAGLADVGRGSLKVCCGQRASALRGLDARAARDVPRSRRRSSRAGRRGGASARPWPTGSRGSALARAAARGGTRRARPRRFLALLTSPDGGIGRGSGRAR